MLNPANNRQRGHSASVVRHVQHLWTMRGSWTAFFFATPQRRNGCRKVWNQDGIVRLYTYIYIYTHIYFVYGLNIVTVARNGVFSKEHFYWLLQYSGHTEHIFQTSNLYLFGGCLPFFAPAPWKATVDFLGEFCWWDERQSFSEGESSIFVLLIPPSIYLKHG